MTFSCSRCQTRYNIADEKVRGKVLQIRCKACQHIIEVRDPDANAAFGLPTAQSSTMSMLGIAALNLEGSLEQSGMRTGPVSQVPGARTAAAPPLSRPMTSSMPALAKPPAPPPAPSTPKPPPPPPPKPGVTLPPSTPRPTLTGARPALAAPSVEPIAEVAEWWYAEGNERRGPCSMRKLGELLQSSALPVDSLVWKPTLPEWKPAKDVAELRGFLPKPKEAAPIAVAPLAVSAPAPAAAQMTTPSTLLAANKPVPPQMVTPSTLLATNKPALQATAPVPAPSTAAPPASTSTEEAPQLQFHSATPQRDIFANVPQVSMAPVPVGEGSALIPLSAGVAAPSKPTSNRSILIVSHLVVAALFFFVGYASRTAQTVTSKELAEANCPPPGANLPTPVFSDSQIKALGGAAITNGTSPTPTTPTKTTGAVANRPIENNPTTPVEVSPDQSQALGLFGNKSSVAPTTVLPNKNTSPTAALPEANAEASRVIADGEAGAKRCIERALASGEIKKETRLEISIQTSAQGKVTSVSVKNSPVASLETCLKNHYGRLSFAKSGQVTLNFSLIASPSY